MYDRKAFSLLCHAAVVHDPHRGAPGFFHAQKEISDPVGAGELPDKPLGGLVCLLAFVKA